MLIYSIANLERKTDDKNMNSMDVDHYVESALL